MKKLLIIDDDSLTLITMSRLFNKEFEVAVCDSAEEFYNKYVNTEFDIIITDISLRGAKDGLVLTTEIKKLPLFSKTPILCLSAHAMNKDRENALAAGVDLFLTKPVSNKILMQTVSQLLAKELDEKV